jgi:hypothetical protein
MRPVNQKIRENIDFFGVPTAQGDRHIKEKSMERREKLQTFAVNSGSFALNYVSYRH